MTISTTAKSKLFVGTTIAATSVGDYDADTWTEVKLIEDLGEFGDEADVIEFATVEDSRMRKLPGIRNAGNLELVVGRDALDAGQVALRAASGQSLAYNFRVVLNDKPTLLGSPTEFFFKAIVASSKNKLGGAKDVVKQTFTLAITSEILEIPALTVAA